MEIKLGQFLYMANCGKLKKLCLSGVKNGVFNNYFIFKNSNKKVPTSELGKTIFTSAFSAIYGGSSK